MPVLANSPITALNNIGTSLVPVIGANPTRNSINFSNPGTVDIIVFPISVLNIVPPAVYTPSLSSLGGGYRVFANGGDLTIEGSTSCQPWQALSVSGSNNPLTIAEG